MLLRNNIDNYLVLFGLICLILHEVLVRTKYSNQKYIAEGRTVSFFNHPVVKERLSGIFLMGICPLIILQPINWMYWLPDLYELFLVIIVCLSITALCKWIVHRYENINHSIVIKSYNDPKLFLNTLLWICYLVAYEFLLRGLLFFPLLTLAGVNIGIVINLLIYAGIHIKKGRMQTAATLPFGMLLILLALKTNSFWPAFIVHLNLALAIEWFMVKKAANRNPLNILKP